MNVIGLDIGYSNLKMCSGDESHHTDVIKPVGVLHGSAAHGGFMGVHLKDAVKVLVDGQQYYAGVSQDHLGDKPRSLHADYPSTIDYRAMFAAALAVSGLKTVDHLVTGLPVEQFLDSACVKRLSASLSGEHKVTPKKTVAVKRVTVVPQPIGGYMSAYQEIPEIEDMRVLVIDPGFFSVDWVIVREGAVEPGTLGTSLKAMSVLLEEASALIQNDYGGRVSVEDIEKAIRQGKDSVRLYGEQIKLDGYLAGAARRVCPMVMTNVLSSIRGVKSEVDAVLLVGGGANFYRDAAKEAFPKAKTIEWANPVIANAEGFWRLATEA